MNFEFDTPYGNNKEVGKYTEINGANIYYEEYGNGEPMFLIHGNSADIRTMGNQIDYFKTKFRVIVADSRGHGKSELNTDSLTYVQIADDWAQLAEHMKLDSYYVIGWSDGGIVGLLMGIRHQNNIKKIVAMGANLRPDTTAIYSWAYNAWKERDIQVKAMIEKGDTSENWSLIKQRRDMVLYQPKISHLDLQKIKCPVLIIAGDKDIIREEHTVEIFQSIKNAHLCIMPGETHYTPASNPSYFNNIAAKFIAEPFIRLDSNLSKN
jgi:pimeloyl-ACP methyl ester carboxylesterase